MQLVDETRLQILPDCRDTATDADILMVGRFFRALQRSELATMEDVPQADRAALNK